MSEKSEREVTILKRWLNEQDAECALLKDRLGIAEAALAPLQALVDEARKVIEPFAAYGRCIHPAATDDILLLGYEGAPVAIGNMRAAAAWLSATPTDLLNKRLAEAWDQALAFGCAKWHFSLTKPMQEEECRQISAKRNPYRQPATEPQNGEMEMSETMELDGMAKHASVMAEVVTLSREEIRAKYSTDPNWPIQSFDATDWARAYCARNPAADEGLMVTWFANALMRGFDEANTRNATQPQIVKEGE